MMYGEEIYSTQPSITPHSTGGYNYNYTPRNNNTNNTTPPQGGVSQEVIYAIFIFNGIMSFCGLLGNIFVCLIIIRGRKMYTIANLFLMNLAIADIGILVISYPLWVIKTLSGSWPFGAALCKIVLSVSDGFYGVSLGCMTSISIHRYRMILHAMSPQLTFFQAKLIIIFIWFISLGTISVPLYPVLKYIKNQGTYQCGSQWPSKSYEQSYQTFLAVAWYILPLLIILCTFLRIRYYLRKQMQYEWMQSSRQNVLVSNHILGIKKALRMLAPVVIIFAILMFPWNALRVISLFVFLPTITHSELYIFIAGTMLVANSVVNPFIYYIMSVEFRVEFRKQVWLIKKLCGFKNIDDEYTIEYDRSGRRYVRRLDSIATSEYHMTGNSRAEFKRRLSNTSNRQESFMRNKDKLCNGNANNENRMNEINRKYMKLNNGEPLLNKDNNVYNQLDINENSLSNCEKSLVEDTVCLLSDMSTANFISSNGLKITYDDEISDGFLTCEEDLDKMRETVL